MKASEAAVASAKVAAAAAVLAANGAATTGPRGTYAATAAAAAATPPPSEPSGPAHNAGVADKKAMASHGVKVEALLAKFQTAQLNKEAAQTQTASSVLIVDNANESSTIEFVGSLRRLCEQLNKPEYKGLIDEEVRKSLLVFTGYARRGIRVGRLFLVVFPEHCTFDFHVLFLIVVARVADY